jgi:hypothetical protein
LRPARLDQECPRFSLFRDGTIDNPSRMAAFVALSLWPSRLIASS